VSENIRRRRDLQSFLEQLEKSPLGQQIRHLNETFAKMRERGLLPTSEQLEKMQAMFKAFDKNSPLGRHFAEQRAALRQQEIEEEQREAAEEARKIEEERHKLEQAREAEEAARNLERIQAVTGKQTHARKHKRPRHRPLIVFPHLTEALAVLERKLKDPALVASPKKQTAVVIDALRDLGDTVKDNQADTIWRRIQAWQKQRNQ
jgi:hypothetical protein